MENYPGSLSALSSSKMVHRLGPKCNPEADHSYLQPCMMIQAMASLTRSDHILAGEARTMTFDMVRGMFDITRRDLCFGGYAPWEAEPSKQ
jgi:hypothetical protein